MESEAVRFPEEKKLIEIFVQRTGKKIVYFVAGMERTSPHSVLFVELLCVALTNGGHAMNGLIYLIGLIVVIMAILSFFGLR